MHLPRLYRAYSWVPFLALILPTIALASSLNRIDDWAEARGWEGVGLLAIGRNATCSAALIRPDLVLTAAHCLYDQSGQLIAPTTVEFLAAWRDGQAISRRTGRRALVHSGYEPSSRPTDANIYRDLALLQLDMPVDGATAAPFALGNAPAEGSDISVVSYGAGRNDAASLEPQCQLRERYGGVFAMTCSVVPGSSGAPVFVHRHGKPVIFSVISALGHDGTAYGMDMSDHINDLLRDFDAGRGVYPAAVQTTRRIKIGQTAGTGKSSSGGALFLKP